MLMIKTVRITIFLVLLFLLFVPLANPVSAAAPVRLDSPIDDFLRWLENAFADIRIFFDNLGENLSHVIEDMFESVRNFGEALGDQFTEAVEGIRQE
jgi:predicted PurR-regulated permease PerM